MKGAVMGRKKVINDYNYFDNEPGDIIDKVAKEHEYLKKVSHRDSEDTELNIESVIEFYHKRLYTSTSLGTGENQDALSCLEKLGLKKQANYERFKIGFAPRQGSGQADGSILNSLSKKQIQALKKLKLIEEDDAEYFNNCLIFPIFNESGKVSSIYGFDIILFKKLLSTKNIHLSKLFGRVL